MRIVQVNKQDRESTERYTGRPFLRFIEAYVLNAIGGLSTEDREWLARLEPKLRQTLGLEGDWKRIVEQQMDFGPEFAGQVLQLWKRNQERAKTAGDELTPRDFTVMFVDKNFPRSRSERSDE
jgi:hypothetical protein